MGPAYVRKETGWLTNDADLAELLEGVCANLMEDPRGWHRHIELVDGRAKMAQVYPPKLVEAILWTIRYKILKTSAVSAVELDAGGPIADEPERDMA